MEEAAYALLHLKRECIHVEECGAVVVLVVVEEILVAAYGDFLCGWEKGLGPARREKRQVDAETCLDRECCRGKLTRHKN